MKHDMSQYPLKLEGDNVPMVRFHNVTKKYGKLTVLDGLNLDVEAGEMVTIIGPSGSGKTTVLRMLMTLEPIDSGVIYVDGEPLTHMEKNGRLVRANAAHMRKIRSKIGMCFQHFNLFPHMTALGNCIEGPMQVLGMPRKEAEERALELLDLVGMAEKRDQHPSRLSGGQQQRVAREISDRICFFYSGQIEEQGPPETLLDAPQNERTQQFLSAVLEAN